MKLRLILGLIYVTASLFSLHARAEFTVQCHQGGGSDSVKPNFPGGSDSVKPDYDGNKRREPDRLRPDQVTGSTDGNDRVAPSFENQSVTGEKQKLTKEERKARREARRQALREKFAAMKAKLEQYIQANAGSGAGVPNIQDLQTAFEDFKRGPASLAPATLSPAAVTPSVNYESISTGGVGASH